MMVSQIAISVVMTVGMMFVHVSGLRLLLQGTSFHIQHMRSPWIAIDQLVVPAFMGVALFLLHTFEVTAYAILFQYLLGWSFQQALYASAGAYTTASAVAFDKLTQWRIVGALEPVTGMLLLGWSTAFLFTNLQRIMVTDDSHPLEKGAIAPDPQQPQSSGNGSIDP